MESSSVSTDINNGINSILPKSTKFMYNSPPNWDFSKDFYTILRDHLPIEDEKNKILKDLKKLNNTLDKVQTRDIKKLKIPYEMVFHKIEFLIKHFKAKNRNRNLDIYFKQEVERNLEDLDIELIKIAVSHLKKEGKDAKDDTYCTQLMKSALKNKCWKFACFLADQGANYNTKIGNHDDTNLKYKVNEGPLFRAVSCDRVDLLKSLVHDLIKKGKNINPCNTEGITPLHIAMFRKNQYVVDYYRSIIYLLPDLNPLTISCHSPSYFSFYTNTDYPFKFPQDESLNREVFLRKMLINLFTPIPLTETSISSNDRHTNPLRKKLPTEIYLNGGTPSSGYLILKRILDEFIIKNGSNNFLSSFQKIMGINSSKESKDSLLKKFYKGEPLIFHSGTSQHVIGMIFIDKYLLICNRGRGSKKQSVVIHEIDRQKATLDLNDIRKIRNADLEGSVGLFFIYDQLPKRAGALEDQTSVAKIFKPLEMEDQRGANCFILSIKTGYLAVLQILLTLGCPESKRELKKEEIYEKALFIYKWFSEFGKIYILKEYLKNKIQEKEANIPDLIDPDMELLPLVIEKLMQKLWWRHPEEQQEIKDLINRFDQLYGSSLNNHLNAPNRSNILPRPFLCPLDF